MKRFSDDDIIRGLRKRDNLVIQYIYKTNFDKIANLILNNSGADDDAEDIFQEALIIIFKRIREDQFELTSAFSTYIYSVARLLWLKKLRDTRKMEVTELNREMEDFIEFEEPPPVQDKDRRLAIYQKNLKFIPEDCQKILTLTAKDVSAKDIAEQLGFRSDGYVRKRRHFCKEFLVNRIKEDPDYLDMMDMD